MAKRVRVTIDVSSSFVRILHAHVHLNGGVLVDRPLDPSGVLTRLIYAEARGALDEQVDAVIPPEWRSDVQAIHAERKVFADEDAPHARQS